MAITNVPIQLTCFVGRERELVDVQRLLSTSRLVTLSGAGGCGKTRLAIQIAKTLSDTYTDGVWMVDLAPLREPVLVPQLVAQTLGSRPPPSQPLLESLLSFVRPKQLLLILDNCEHLIGACAQLTLQLLSHTSDLRVLATSREPLALAGEMIYRVHGLAWPALAAETSRDWPSGGDPQELLQYDAVRLFVERTAAIAPTFTITSYNAPAIVEICRRLDGIPLALELASARINILTVRQIAARLDDRFALLTSESRTGLVPHHQTLRAAINWSYALLTAEEQTLLSRLAVFATGFTLDTAEAVCSGEGAAETRVLDLISSLVDKSLVVAETTNRAQARYRLLETIREYALEQLDAAGEAARLHHRHLNLFLARAEEAAPKLFDAYQQLWLNWLEGEHDNLRAALAWAIESGRIEAGLRIATGLTQFWTIRGYLQEGLAWFERLLPQADERIPVVVRASAFTFAAFLAGFLGHASVAESYGREAVALAESAGDEGKPILGFALGGLVTSAREAGDYQTAFTLIERSVQLFRDSSWPSFYLGMSLLAQGDLAIELGHYDTARAALDESLRLAREAGDAARIAYTFNTLGDLARCEQQYAEAQTAYEQGVALLRELGATRDLAALLHNLGHACLHLGDAERAQILFTGSMATHQAQQNPRGMAECLIGFAALAVVHGLPAAGVRLLAAAAAIGAQHSTSSWAATRKEYEHYLALARASLSAAEFQAELAAGQALLLEQAIEYAQNLPLESRATPANKDRADELTEREREVAALVAQGYSNGEIASALVLSKRTVEKHIANILSKLGLTSRTQIVRWAIDHGLTQLSAS